ncbi:hypothetical protein G6F68_017174 [Rhizopus microsporus]|nr:hypothetical protein G6F68_017174 [Rhizopus microsporus]
MQDAPRAPPAGQQAQPDANQPAQQQPRPRRQQRQLEHLLRDRHADGRRRANGQQRRQCAQCAELHQHRAAQLTPGRAQRAQHRAVIAALAGRGLQCSQQHQHAGQQAEHHHQLHRLRHPLHHIAHLRDHRIHVQQ